MRLAMTPFAAIVIALVVVLPAAEAQNIQGDWQLKSCTINGQEISAKKLKDMRLTMTLSSFDAIDGKRKSSGQLETESRQSPSRMTFTIDSGDDSGRELKAIYKRQSAELQIAFSRTGEFPTEFESSASNQYAVMKYDYIKKKRKVVTDAERRARRAPTEIRGVSGGG